MISEADILTRRALELEAKLAERDATTRVLEDRLAGVHNTAQLRAQHVADLQARVAGQEVEAAKAREDYRVQVGELKAQLADVRGLYAAALDHVVDADRQAEEARAQVAALQAENAELKRGLAFTVAACDQAREQGAEAAAQVATLTKRCEAAETAARRAYEAADKPDGHASWQELWTALEQVMEILGAALESNDGGGSG